MTDDPGVGFRDEENRARGYRIRVDSKGISVERKGSGGRLRKHIEKGFPKSDILVPLRMGWKMSPIRRPVAYEFVILCGRRRRKMSNPGINPSHRIGNICTVYRNFMTDEKIFRDIFFNPFPKLMFLFNRPLTIIHLPDLKGGFLDCLAEGRSGEKDEGQ